MKFPAVSGYNLHREKKHLPADLEGQVNLLFVPFWQRQQFDVDTWVPAARRIEAEIPALRYYELPTIQKMNFFAELFINEGMRAGIPNSLTRQRTITLYLDKNEFRQALEIDSESQISILLVDRSGEVIWRAEGRYSPEKEASLLQALEQTALVASHRG